MLRPREILTSIAAAGLGGAIGSLIGNRIHGGRRTGPARSVRRRRELDGVDTAAITDVEVIVLEADLPVDDELIDISIFDDPAAGADILNPLDARPATAAPEGRTRSGSMAADMVEDGDADNGENWIETMLVTTAEATPSRRPLRARTELDQAVHDANARIGDLDREAGDVPIADRGAGGLDED